MALASENADKFCRIITQWRLMRGLSQQALGEAIGHSQRHISFIENGRTKPSRATVERLVEALSIPPRDGNRLLNLLGYSDSLEAKLGVPALDETGLNIVKDAWLNGMFPVPASVIGERHRMERLNLSLALWLNRVAEVEEIFDEGRLSWPSLIFHPEGLRKYMEGWEELAAAYLQIVNRELLRNPVAGAQLMNRVQRVFDVPSSWKSLSDRYPGTLGSLMRSATKLGPIAFEFVVFEVAAPPSQPSLDFLSFMVGAIIPADEEARQQIAAIMAQVTPDDIHENLRPGLVYR